PWCPGWRSAASTCPHLGGRPGWRNRTSRRGIGLLLGGRTGLGRRHLGDADATDAPALDPLGDEPVAVADDALTLGRYVTEQAVHQPPHRVPVALGQLGAA